MTPDDWGHSRTPDNSTVRLAADDPIPYVAKWACFLQFSVPDKTTDFCTKFVFFLRFCFPLRALQKS